MAAPLNSACTELKQARHELEQAKRRVEYAVVTLEAWAAVDTVERRTREAGEKSRAPEVTE